jgi:integral membrane protein
VFDQPQYSAIVGPVHGFLYVVYLVLAVDLGLKARWPIVKTGLILLAGMIPFVSFVAERKVTKELSEG